MSDDEFEKAMKQYKTGQKAEVTISNITPFGLFVLLGSSQKGSGQAGQGNYEGFIHISEIAWEKVDDLTELYSQGQKLEAVVIRFDKENRRINLSVKKLTEDPFEELIKDYPVDKKVTGKVKSTEDAGVSIELDGVEGFIKKEKIPPMTTYTEGQEITLTVSEHDKRRHRIILTPVLKEKPIGYR